MHVKRHETIGAIVHSFATSSNFDNVKILLDLGDQNSL